MSISLMILLLLAYAEPSLAKSLPEVFPTVGCQVIQEDGVLSGKTKKQEFNIALGQCGSEWTVWLLQKHAGPQVESTKILDTIKLPALKENESLNLAGGACVRGKKPVLDNIILLAILNNRDSISGDNIVKVWSADLRRKQLVEITKNDLVCYKDQP